MTSASTAASAGVGVTERLAVCTECPASDQSWDSAPPTLPAPTIAIFIYKAYGRRIPSASTHFFVHGSDGCRFRDYADRRLPREDRHRCYRWQVEAADPL